MEDKLRHLGIVPYITGQKGTQNMRCHYRAGKTPAHNTSTTNRIGANHSPLCAWDARTTSPRMLSPAASVRGVFFLTPSTKHVPTPTLRPRRVYLGWVQPRLGAISSRERSRPFIYTPGPPGAPFLAISSKRARLWSERSHLSMSKCCTAKTKLNNEITVL